MVLPYQLFVYVYNDLTERTCSSHLDQMTHVHPWCQTVGSGEVREMVEIGLKVSFRCLSSLAGLVFCL